MPGDEKVELVVRGWVGKAEGDLKNASHALKLGKECPTDTVGFHAQQCTEKYLKALLVLRKIEFPRTHDIERLVRLAPAGVLADWPVAEQRRLTVYAVETRYPGDYEPLTLGEARQAVRVARQVRSAIRKLLPRAVLRKKPASGR